MFLLFHQEPYIYGIKRHSWEQGNNIFYIVQNDEYLYKYTVFPVREYAHIYARKEFGPVVPPICEGRSHKE